MISLQCLSEHWDASDSSSVLMVLSLPSIGKELGAYESLLLKGLSYGRVLAIGCVKYCVCLTYLDTQ
jgi:hypothetical protein